MPQNFPVSSKLRHIVATEPSQQIGQSRGSNSIHLRHVEVVKFKASIRVGTKALIGILAF